MASELKKPFPIGQIAWILVWGGALYATLQVHLLEGTHAICGPWGCGPPVSALVGYHGFWLLLVLPAALIVAKKLPLESAKRVGKVLALAGLAGVIVLVAVDAVKFLQHASPQYLLQRCFFRLATFVDFPLVPMALAGWLMRRWANSKEAAQDSTTAADPV